MDIFEQVLAILKDGIKLTFTQKNVADGDDFLKFFGWRPEITVTFKKINGLWWLYFENDEPMMLGDAPKSFYESIIKVAGEQM